LDRFDEQVNDPALMTRRGLRPGQPLPPGLGLFDDEGRLCSPLQRDALEELERWLGDHDAILDWFFPADQGQGLDPAMEKNLRAQLETLAGQPWSPQEALRAVLADWPTDQPERDTTLAPEQSCCRGPCPGSGPRQAYRRHCPRRAIQMGGGASGW